MQLKDEILGQELGGAPYDPADSDVGHSVLVTRDVDGLDSRQAEVPDELSEFKGL